MPSATQQANPYGVFANTLSQLTGLNVSVIDAWATAENGGNNNILGMTYSSLKTSANPHGLQSYSSQTQAAIDTANRINTSPLYAGIRASTGGTASQQALAIAKSPWRTGDTSGTIDTYYLKVFSGLGLLTSTGSPTTLGQSGGTGGGPIAGALTGAAGTTGGGILGALATAASTPFIFIGIIIMAAVFVLLGGLVMLKGKS